MGGCRVNSITLLAFENHISIALSRAIAHPDMSTCACGTSKSTLTSGNGMMYRFLKSPGMESPAKSAFPRADDSCRKGSRAAGRISFFVFEAILVFLEPRAPTLRVCHVKGDLIAVAREAGVVQIDAEELQKGEVVLLQTGDIVPADLKLLEASDLEVDEFELRGEILPVPKHVYPETDSLLLRGSRVLGGHGSGIVTATGEDTEYGRILKQSSQHKECEAIRFGKTPHFIIPLFLVPVLLIRWKSHGDHAALIVIYAILALLLLLLQNGEWLKSTLMKYGRKRLFKRSIFLRYAEVLREIDGVDVFCFDK